MASICFDLKFCNIIVFSFVNTLPALINFGPEFPLSSHPCNNNNNKKKNIAAKLHITIGKILKYRWLGSQVGQ